MFKYLNPKRFYFAVGRKRFIEFIIFAVFILFFYGPLLNMCMLAFADTYTVPYHIPQKNGRRRSTPRADCAGPPPRKSSRYTNFYRR